MQRSREGPITIEVEGRPVKANDPVKPGIHPVQAVIGIDIKLAQGPHAKATQRRLIQQSDNDALSNP